MRALLDVNVLIALLDPDHVMHDLATDWFAKQKEEGWATCPITENGFIRIVSHPSYSNSVTVHEAVEALRAAVDMPSYEFWPCDVTLTDASKLDNSRLIGTNQVTDAYLLALASERGGCLATFDRRISITLVPDATSAQLVIIPSPNPG
jgi:toxin-antitoxin system PIN domain toxin